MAKKWYEKTGGGTELSIWADPEVQTQADLQAMLPLLQEIQGLTDDLRTLLAGQGIPSLGIPSSPDLATFDDIVNEEVWRLQDVLDYFDYGNRVENVTVQDGMWMTPEAVESFCGEETGEETGLAIDDANGTWWAHVLDHAHEIVFRLRGYPKKVEKIRLRTTSGDLRAQLQGVDVHMAKSLPGIDDPENIVGNGVNFTYAGDNWMEWTLPVPKSSARYIKLTGFGSLNTSNQVRIREIDAWVTTKAHKK